jgi:AAA15 family ATPase/GTPase
MILQLTIKNVLSFREEETFSFEATKDTSFEEYQVVEVAPNVRILRLALVYGANASGKSNLVAIFDYLRRFWFNKPLDKDKPTGVVPFLLNKQTPNEPSEFTLLFYIDGTKYKYHLQLTQKAVLREELYIYPSTQPAYIFKRALKNGVSEITFNTNRMKISEVAKEEIQLKCLPNMSVLAAFNQVNVAMPEMEKVVSGLKRQYFPTIGPDVKLMKFVEHEILKKKDNTKDFILNYLKRADFNITDIIIETVTENIPEKILSAILNDDDIPDEEKERFKKEKTMQRTKTEFEHRVVNDAGREEFYPLQKGLQSKGTLRTFGLAGVIHEVVKSDAFLAIDEIESSLHPRLIEFIIEDFFKQKGQSQLLLTTHYDGLLAEDDLLRKDSIWFTNKRANGSTELYSLADFKGVNRISSLQRAYRYGRFGAVPNI